MKQISLIVYMLLCCAAQVANAQDLNLRMRYEVTEKNGLIYDRGRPFTGTVFEMSHNDVKILDAKYLNGKRNGRYIEKHPNGKVKFEAVYNDGKLADGTHTEFDSAGKKSVSKTVKNGMVVREDFFSLGKMHRSVDYRGNGEIDKETPYKNGLKDGEVKRFDSNGRIIEKEIYVQDVLKSRMNLEYHGNGKLRIQAETNANGIKNGIVEEYFQSGGLSKKSRYENGSEREVLEEHVDPNITVESFLNRGEQLYLCTALDGGKEVAYVQVIFDFQNNSTGTQIKDKILQGLKKRFTPLYGSTLGQHGDKPVTYKVTFNNPQVATIYDDGRGSIGGVISTQTTPGYRGKATVHCTVDDLKAGRTVASKTISGLTGKTSDRNAAQSGSYNAMAWAVDDLTYGFFKLSGKLVSILESNRKGEPTRVEVNLGKSHSLANGFEFNVYTLNGSQRQNIGYLILQDVLNDSSSRCKVKKGHREIMELMNSGTPLYVEGDYRF